MSGRIFNQPIQSKPRCINQNCNKQVYKYQNEIYPLFCYDCQKRSDAETKATKPKNHKYTKYDKSY